ncbi:MAG: TetR/AcrR family transcriptional regulator, partial [Armatimonadetes bacterium]|nr:TetR/AcrR family transcriptional regulator [Armatimonadota bacterium]
MSDTSEPRRLPPEQRREEILSAAVQLFCEKGYEGTTIKDIARAIGVTEGLLYHYFSGKADLIAECWRRRSWHTRACAIVEQAGDRPFGEVVSDLVRDHLDSLYSNGPAFRMHAAEMLRDGELASFSQQYIHETR